MPSEPPRSAGSCARGVCWVLPRASLPLVPQAQGCAWGSRLAPVICHCHLSSQPAALGDGSTVLLCSVLACKITFFSLSFIDKRQAQMQNLPVFCYFWFSALSGLFPTSLQGIFGGSRISSLEGHRGAHPGSALRHLAQDKRQISHQKAF